MWSLYFPVDPSQSLLCSLLFLTLTLFGAQFNGSCWWVEGMGEPVPLTPALGKGQMAHQDFAVWHISDSMLHEELTSLKLGDLHC